MWAMKRINFRRNRIKIVIACLMTLLVVYVVIYVTRDGESQFSSVERISSSWHRIFGTTFMYSAYWDDRDDPHVKVLASGPYDERLDTVRCFVSTRGAAVLEANATFDIMDFENHGEMHTPLFFLCYPGDGERPEKIMLSAAHGGNSTWMPVRTLTPTSNVRNKIAACVRPLFGTFPNDNLQVAEFVAFYRLLGVDRFVFYNLEAESSLLRLLREIESTGVSIDILPWDLPGEVRDTWAYGQVLSITDCVYRVASTHEFALVIDLDEFIVPRENYTLQAVIASTGNSQRAASFVFRHIFFCLDYASFSRRTKLPLITQTVDLRKREVFPWNKRAKSIVRPLAVILPGIHKILVSRHRWKPITVVERELAVMHHYRRGVCSLWNKLGYDSLRDPEAFRFRKELLESSPIKAWKHLYDRSNLVV